LEDNEDLNESTRKGSRKDSKTSSKRGKRGSEPDSFDDKNEVAEEPKEESKRERKKESRKDSKTSSKKGKRGSEPDSLEDNEDLNESTKKGSRKDSKTSSKKGKRGSEPDSFDDNEDLAEDPKEESKRERKKESKADRKTRKSESEENPDEHPKKDTTKGLKKDSKKGLTSGRSSPTFGEFGAGSLAPSRSVPASSPDGTLLWGFEWGTDDSDYSTDFTGYSECSQSLSDTPIPEVDLISVSLPPISPKINVSGVHTLRGTLQGCVDLSNPDDHDLNTFVTLQMFSRAGREKLGTVNSHLVSETTSPQWNIPFSFEKVHRGSELHVVVWQDHPKLDIIQIGRAVLRVMDVELNKRHKYTLDLEKPPDYPASRGKVKDWGKVSLALKHTFTPRTSS
jgi:hypothetical protein